MSLNIYIQYSVLLFFVGLVTACKEVEHVQSEAVRKVTLCEERPKWMMQFPTTSEGEVQRKRVLDGNLMRQRCELVTYVDINKDGRQDVVLRYPEQENEQQQIWQGLYLQCGDGSYVIAFEGFADSLQVCPSTRVVRRGGHKGERWHTLVTSMPVDGATRVDTLSFTGQRYE